MEPDQLITKSATELVSLIKARQISPVQLVAAYLEQIERVNPALNAVVTLAPDALDQARTAEAKLMRGDDLGPLHGLPLTIKDTIATAGIRTTSGSRLRENYLPAQDAEVVARLKAAGAIILGKTNTPEMAIPYETDNSIFGRTNNPYDVRLTSGGSSGGEAAAIAACLSAAGLGSDLSGSIRVPAHFCGIVGLRPTSGRIPMHGHFPEAHGPLAFGASIGPMARRVGDVALVFSVLAESESSVPMDEGNLKGLRVGWYDYDGVAPVSTETKHAIKAAVRALKNAGLDPVEERPPGVESGSRLWLDLFSHVSAADLKKSYSGSEELAGLVARKVLEAANQREAQSPDALRHALGQRDRLRSELIAWMHNTPLIVAPVGATAAFPHCTARLNINDETISVFRSFSYAQTFNVFDLPSIVVRAGRTSDGLPVGVQIVGLPFREDLILAAAAIIETQMGGWEPPPLMTLG